MQRDKYSKYSSKNINFVTRDYTKTSYCESLRMDSKVIWIEMKALI